MRRMVAAVLFAACACGGSSGVDIERQGFSRRDGRLGVAALIRASDNIQDVAIEIALYEGDRLLRTERSTLPFCMPDVACWWAESYTTAPPGVDRVEVSVGTGRASTEPHEVIAMEEPGRSPAAGTLFIVDEGPPAWGTAMTVERGDRISAGYLYVGAAVDRGEPGAD